MTGSPRATVVVPTRDRPAALRRCLAALAAQSIAREIEVVVVDDASHQPVELAAFARACAPRLVRHDAAGGPAAARNTGVRTASAPIVLFTDDDCEPAADWATELVAPIERGAAAAAGPTVAGTDAAIARAAQMVTNSIVAPVGGRLRFAPSSNLAARRDVLLAVPFDETFADPGGEDRVWCSRLAAAGHPLEYVPGALVRHCPDLDFRAFWRQQVRYGAAARRVFGADPNARMGGLGFSFGLVRRAVRDGWAVGGLVALSQVANAWGYARAGR